MLQWLVYTTIVLAPSVLGFNPLRAYTTIVLAPSVLGFNPLGVSVVKGKCGLCVASASAEVGNVVQVYGENVVC